MANTYTHMYIQFVFAVQNRMSMIQASWKSELFIYMTGIIQNNKHKLIAINGMPNHVHVFIGNKPHQLIPDLMQDIKGSLSFWINKKGFITGKFSWQNSYGAFSYSQSHIDRVAKYIRDQEQHHKKKTFKEEYLDFLNKYNVEYDEPYVLKDVQ